MAATTATTAASTAATATSVGTLLSAFVPPSNLLTVHTEGLDGPPP